MRLASFSKVLPDQSIPTTDCVIAAGQPPLEAKAFQRIFGINEVRKWPSEFTISDVLPQLLKQLQTGSDDPDCAIKAPDVFIYVHACPLHAMSAAPSLKSLRDTHPFLEHVDQVYEIDQYCCASLFWALKAAQNMLKRGTATSVVIIAGESFSDLPLRERYMPACTILGDAFTGLLIDAEPTGIQISDIVLQNNPEYHFGLYASDKEVQSFNRDQVRLTTAVLNEMGFEPGSGEPILPHNINSFAWSQYCSASGAKMEDIWLDLLADHGHCCTTDAFLNIGRLQADETAKTAVLVGVGQGGFVGGCRLHKPVKGGVYATC